MPAALFKHHDLSDRRRLLVAGDVHGRFDLLSGRLDAFDFDPELDTLVLLGDLVDRGPFSREALAWCEMPGVLRVLGNHEQLLHRAVVGTRSDQSLHSQNGGAWFEAVVDTAERQRWSEVLMNCPVAIEAVTPGGRRVGFVHADVPTPTWQALAPALATSRRMFDTHDLEDRSSIAWRCIWDRDRIERVRRATLFPHLVDGADIKVAGIDHVFFGHTIVAEPLTSGNCSWIDTGAFRSNLVTVIDVDSWMDALSA